MNQNTLRELKSGRAILRGIAFTIIALLVFGFGYWWFARTRKGFADVI